MSESSPLRVAVADDEESMRYFLRRALTRAGYHTEVFENGAALLEASARRPFDAALLDLKMPGLDGLEVLRRLRAEVPDAVVVLMTAFATVETAVDAMKSGAADYLRKPFEAEELWVVLERALERRSERRTVRDLRAFFDQRSSYAGLVGQSKAMKAVFQAIETLAASQSTVLIRGESGTGKELVARAIHEQSPRADRPFVPLHCAALPESLIENELFGHEAGAFTGAQDRKHGLILRAEGGTLFLDEIGELSLPVQAKISRFLQERSFQALGSTEVQEVDLRVVAATNRDLAAAVRAASFREELYWRLNVVPIDLPPLRDRPEDVPALVAHFLSRLSARLGTPSPTIELEAMVALASYRWPGNIRELQNTVERLVVLHPDHDSIGLEDLPLELRAGAILAEAPGSAGPASGGEKSYQRALERFEREYFHELVREAGGNVSEAARRAGLSRAHLHRKLRQLGIQAGELR